MIRIKKLNKPYNRIGIIIDGMFMMVDGAVKVLSFGHLDSQLYIWKMERDLNKFQKYIKSVFDENRNYKE